MNSISKLKDFQVEGKKWLIFHTDIEFAFNNSFINKIPSKTKKNAKTFALVAFGLRKVCENNKFWESLGNILQGFSVLKILM